MRIQSLEIPALRRLLNVEAMAVCLFARDMLELDETSKTTSNDLYSAYVKWALGQTPRQPMLSKVAFGRLLENTISLVPISTRIKGENARIWHGVELKNDDATGNRTI